MPPQMACWRRACGFEASWQSSANPTADSGVPTKIELAATNHPHEPSFFHDGRATTEGFVSPGGAGGGTGCLGASGPATATARVAREAGGSPSACALTSSATRAAAVRGEIARFIAVRVNQRSFTLTRGNVSSTRRGASRPELRPARRRERHPPEGGRGDPGIESTPTSGKRSSSGKPSARSRTAPVAVDGDDVPVVLRGEERSVAEGQADAGGSTRRCTNGDELDAPPISDSALAMRGSSSASRGARGRFSSAQTGPGARSPGPRWARRSSG